MRKIFIEELMNQAAADKSIMLLTADLGYKVFEEFQSRFPEQFINAGVAEANMVGVASGLAMSGKRVFIYSIVPFVTFRVCEQIRNHICAHNLDIKIIGVGGGFSYGAQGMSHNTTEDLSIMRSLPNMSVIFPADIEEAKQAGRILFSHIGPLYLRIGKACADKIYKKMPVFKIGQGITVRPGKDIAIISIGNIIETVLKAADMLEAGHLSVRVISMPCLKPLDEALVKKTAKETRAIFTVEEHSTIGGLGSAVAEVLAEDNTCSVLFKKIALPDAYTGELGDQEYLRRFYGLSPANIANEILKSLSNQ